ncbi:ATP-binding protein [Allobacillus sp. GCM10007491]|uniref:histidine kinase n=2 Tax=Allobacillus TaxID=1400133 RepID=A0A941HS05_9BACI|nr:MULTISPECIES: ATP-binding protein [Allobacillus]MBR7553151.1 PAS domain S-box protein [Allobacillus saliphilus]TSJ67248.1 PAS domain S-box protein [Allobacillus salarius]
MLINNHNEELLQQAFEWIDEQISDYFFLCDEELIIQHASHSIEKAGFTREQVIGESAITFVDSVDSEKFLQEINQLEVNAIKRNVFRVINVNNELRRHEVSMGKMIYDKTGDIFYIFLAKDITNILETENLLIQSEKLSSAGQLAASVAHEIRNPLTSLKGFLQLMEAGMDNSGTYLKIMKEEIEKIEAISKELLFIAKPSPNELKRENLIELVGEVCLLMNSQARMHDIRLKKKFDCEEFMLNCDRSQFKQVLINLIKNAIEAMEENGTIEIHIHTKEQLLIEVMDEGPGVPEEMKEKLGEPFYTTKQNGTGLGLMVTKQILKNHGAKLEVKDREIKGSNFRISFKDLD